MHCSLDLLLVLVTTVVTRLSLLEVLHFFRDHVSCNVYVFGNVSIVIYMFLLQQSRHSAVHVSLEIMPRANSICGHEWYCVPL